LPHALLRGAIVKALSLEDNLALAIGNQLDISERAAKQIAELVARICGRMLSDIDAISAPPEIDEGNARYHVDRFLSQCGPYPSGHFHGRGIVICGGGQRYFRCAWVCMNMLRKFGCQLPIELWYLGQYELDERMKALVNPIGVHCVNAADVRKIYPVRILRGWELKPYSILHSSFEEVLLLDADNVAIVNPEFLFESLPYVNTGAIFWPDAERLPATHKVWEVCKIPYRDEPEFESGQIVVDKRRCWTALQLTMHLNEHSDFYYRLVHGDKDTFHLAWRILEKHYSMVPVPMHPIRGTMCQHDFGGRRIFQHRHSFKWACDRSTKVPGFKFEAECVEFCSRLDEQWNGIINAPGDGEGELMPQQSPDTTQRPESKGMMQAENPVVLLVNGLGDHLLALPALRALAQLFSGRLTLVCLRGACQTFFSDIPFRRVCELHDVWQCDGELAYDGAEVATMLGPCDLFVSLNRSVSPTTAQLLASISPRYSIGLFSAFRTEVRFSSASHAVDLAFEIPRQLDPTLQVAEYAAAPSLPDDSRHLGRDLRSMFPPSTKALVVHADTATNKMWPRARFVQCLDSFLDSHPDFVVFVVGTTDCHLNVGRFGHRVVLCYGLPLTASMAVVQLADCFLGVDSCMLHAADLFGVPSVGLFGPTSSQEFGCRFCQHIHVCGKGNMDSIRTSDVLDALNSVVSAGDPSSLM
jgi:ADP-heptose:LPS heptosyltransferase